MDKSSVVATNQFAWFALLRSAFVNASLAGRWQTELIGTTRTWQPAISGRRTDDAIIFTKLPATRKLEISEFSSVVAFEHPTKRMATTKYAERFNVGLGDIFSPAALDAQSISMGD